MIVPCASKAAFSKAAAGITTDLMRQLSGYARFQYEDGVLSPLRFTEDDKVNFVKETDIIWAQMQRIGEGLGTVGPQSGAIKTSIFSYPRKTSEDGTASLFHPDRNSIIAHATICGGTLEFLTPDTTVEEKNAINKARRESISLEGTAYQSHILTVKSGDMILFNDTLEHRTTSEIWEKGQLAVAGHIPCP
ncbi:MAG: hypothetical protein R3D66_04295 [Alphaproteobacteria bacterium]